MVVYSYGGRAAHLWWAQHRDKLARLPNFTVINLPAAATQALAKLARRTMGLQCTIQDGGMWVADENDRIEINPVTLKSGGVRDATRWEGGRSSLIQLKDG